MSLRTGKVIIAKNIKLDKNYTNVLNYSESDMLSLVQTNKVAESSDCSFIKIGQNVIDTNFSYNDALKSNYIALQNPSYANKWFFGFIDEVEYISNGNARIHYTIDEHSTWFDYWESKACFVIREHVDDDTIGLHTTPENIETGEYVINNVIKKNSLTYRGFVIASTIDLLSPKVDDKYQNVSGGIYGGVYSGSKYYYFGTIEDINEKLLDVADCGQSSSILSIFAVPTTMIETTNNVLNDSATVISQDWAYAIFGGESDITPSKPNTINGYTPINKKLMTFPYCYLLASNNSGGNAIYHYELFSGDVTDFKLYGTITPGMSITMSPKNYNGSSINYEETLACGKFPIANWNTDQYKNWIAQNGLNVGLSATSSLIGIGVGIATANPIAIASGTIGLTQTVGQISQQKMIPPHNEGNLNIGDVTYASGNLTFTLYQMSIKEENARIIDDYFTKHGYKINRIKIPNITGRPYYNFVQISNEDSIGYPTNQNYSVPSSSMEVINSIYRKGVTVWHNHVHIGNYYLDNSL